MQIEEMLGISLEDLEKLFTKKYVLPEKEPENVIDWIPWAIITRGRKLLEEEIQ